MLNTQKSLLTVIDVQEKLVNSMKYGFEATQNTEKLIKAANILSIPIIITEQYPKGLGQTVPSIKSLLNDTNFITEKTTFSAFQNSLFKEKLTSSNKNLIVICGIETHICVLQTAAELLNEGYEVYVVKDACASRKTENYKTGLSVLKQYGAKITDLEITLFEWLRTANHPNFKEIQSLIK